MINRRNRRSRWPWFRIAGRMGLALFGGGVFAVLAWNPRSPPGKENQKDSLDSDRSSQPRSASATVVPAALRRADRISKRWNGDGAMLLNEASDRPFASGIALLDSKKRPDSKLKALTSFHQTDPSERLTGMAANEKKVATTTSDQNPRGPPGPL